MFQISHAMVVGDNTKQRLRTNTATPTRAKFMRSTLFSCLLIMMLNFSSCCKALKINPCIDDRLLNTDFKFLGLSATTIYPDWTYLPHFFYPGETCNGEDIYIRFNQDETISGTLASGQFEGSHTWSCNGQQKLPAFRIQHPTVQETQVICDSVFLDAFSTIEQRYYFKDDTTLFMFYDPNDLASILVFSKK